MSRSDLLHDALKRHASQQHMHDDPNALSPRLGSMALSGGSGGSGEEDDDDDAEVEVRTAASSMPGTPRTISRSSTPGHSRSSSPTRQSSSSSGRKRGGGAGKPPRDKTKEREKALANANKQDPLNRFPGEVNGRIFGQLSLRDLLACGLVCKRWRKSQTLNYTWFMLLQRLTWIPQTGSKPYDETDGLPKWRKADSKVDWAQRFANMYKDDAGNSREESEFDENGLTMKEERELKWREENEDANRPLSKNEAREMYKLMKNSKTKGKSGKGGERTWTVDL